jgi:hypothetical protein
MIYYWRKAWCIKETSERAFGMARCVAMFEEFAIVAGTCRTISVWGVLACFPRLCSVEIATV